MNKKSLKFLAIGIVILIMGASFAAAYAEGKKQDKRITITLSEQEWGIVLNGLQELPLKVSGNVYTSIMQQAQMQLQAQQKPVVKDTTTKKKP